MVTKYRSWQTAFTQISECRGLLVVAPYLYVCLLRYKLLVPASNGDCLTSPIQVLVVACGGTEYQWCWWAVCRDYLWAYRTRRNTAHKRHGRPF